MMESGRRHWQPHLQRLQDQIGQANTPQELQYYCMVKIDIEYQLECLEWKTGAGYEAWLKEERQRLQNMGSYSEYNIWVDKELERVGRDMDLESIKAEIIKEEVIQENYKEESTEEALIKEEFGEQVFIEKESIEGKHIKEENIKEELTEEVFIKSES
ncbi:hypothetical protein EYC84_000809 [Monilinia fructicola]|uniref:Uncharacterized protein n=1 Tax=Monilinia fructicola TaxID=38448 RepID=A0A5M9JMB9_MONFR|nr:hypothetical protein EYC84_000809 [Monilinia fructicola]